MDPIVVEEVLEIPDGVYRLKVIDVADFVGGFQPTARVVFLVDPATGYQGTVTGLFPARATGRNKTGKLLMACLGECIPGKSYNWTDIRGKYCYGMIENSHTDEGMIPRVRRAIYPEPNAAGVSHSAPSGGLAGGMAVPPVIPKDGYVTAEMHRDAMRSGCAEVGGKEHSGIPF